MAKAPAARVALATGGAAAGRWETKIVGHRTFACVSVPSQRFRAMRSTVCLLAPLISSFGLGAVLVAPQRADAARCNDGSSLAAQIDLAGMEADVSGNKCLSRMLAQVGVQLPAPDLLHCEQRGSGDGGQRPVRQLLLRRRLVRDRQSHHRLQRSHRGKLRCVWIASYSAQATISGTMYITENSGNHP